MALAARFTHDDMRVVASDWRGNVKEFETETGAVALILDPNPPTIETRLASAETEVNQLRVASQQATEQLAAAQAQVAAAEATLAQAKADAQAKTQVQTESAAKLGAAEQRLASVAAEKAALLKAAGEIAEQMTAGKTELATAEAAAAAAKTQSEEAQAGIAKQQATVNELASQLAKLQEMLNTAQATLKGLVDAHAAKEQEAVGADSKVDELKGRIDDLARRQSELETIRKLREQYNKEE
jgi:chromosome segregation ATPase